MTGHAHGVPGRHVHSTECIACKLRCYKYVKLCETTKHVPGVNLAPHSTCVFTSVKEGKNLQLHLFIPRGMRIGHFSEPKRVKTTHYFFLNMFGRYGRYGVIPDICSLSSERTSYEKRSLRKRFGVIA